MLTEAGIIGKLRTSFGPPRGVLERDRHRPAGAAGTPLHVVLRRSSTTARSATRSVRWRAPTSPAPPKLLVAQADAALDIEAMPGDMDVLLPRARRARHATAFLSPLVGVRCLGKQAFPDACPRPRSRTPAARGALGNLTRRRAILRDHADAPDSICRHLDEVVDEAGACTPSLARHGPQHQRAELARRPPCRLVTSDRCDGHQLHTAWPDRSSSSTRPRAGRRQLPPPPLNIPVGEPRETYPGRFVVDGRRASASVITRAATSTTGPTLQNEITPSRGASRPRPLPAKAIWFRVALSATHSMPTMIPRRTRPTAGRIASDAASAPGRRSTAGRLDEALALDDVDVRQPDGARHQVLQ